MGENYFFGRVANLAILRLKEGAAPWQKRCFGEDYGTLPMNPVTGRRYRAGNLLHLMLQEYSDPRWLTYRQAQNLGGQVREGEKGTPILYWIFEEKAGGELVELELPRCFLSYVFNGEQIEGMPVWEQDKEIIQVERAERILAASGAEIIFDQIMPQYRQNQDVIHLPGREKFSDEAAYYSTALHELLHWTGHISRLDRKCGPFGSLDYAREELRAGIGSRLLSTALGIRMSMDRHDGYASGWIQLLKSDPREFFRAAADAEAMADYLLAFSE